MGLTVTTTARSLGTVSCNLSDGMASNFTTTSTTYVEVTGMAFTNINLAQNQYFQIFGYGIYRLQNMTYSRAGNANWKVTEVTSGSAYLEYYYDDYSYTSSNSDYQRQFFSNLASGGYNSLQTSTFPSNATSDSIILQNTLGRTITTLKFFIKLNGYYGATYESLIVYTGQYGTNIPCILNQGELWLKESTTNPIALKGKKFVNQIKAVALPSPYTAGTRFLVNSSIVQGTTTTSPNLFDVRAILDEVTFYSSSTSSPYQQCILYTWSGFYIELI